MMISFCMDTIQRYYRVDRREIFFIQSIFEGYDGLAMMSTIDPTRGLIRLSMSPGTETDVSDILQNLKTSGILIEAMNEFNEEQEPDDSPQSR